MNAADQPLTVQTPGDGSADELIALGYSAFRRSRAS